MKKGAVAGAIVWSAPLLTSSPAFATTGCGGSKPCTTFYYAKFENGTCTGGSGDSENTGCRRPGEPLTLLADALCSQANPQIVSGCDLLSTQQSSFDGDSFHIEYPNDLAPLLVQIKAGNACHSYKVVGTTLEYVESTESVTNPLPTGPNKILVPSTDPCRISTYTVSKSNGTTVIDASWTCDNISHVGTYFCA